MAFFCVWASLTSNIPQNIILHAEGHQTLADAKLINTVAVANFKQVPAAMRFLPTSQLNYVDPPLQKQLHLSWRGQRLKRGKHYK